MAFTTLKTIVSVSSGRMLFISTDLKFNLYCGLLLKLWFTGFYTTRFHFFFIFMYLPNFHVF